eukprot:RCo029540
MGASTCLVSLLVVALLSGLCSPAASPNNSRVLHRTVSLIQEYLMLRPTPAHLLWPGCTNVTLERCILQPFEAVDPLPSRAAVIIMPGGAYRLHAEDMEGAVVAKWFAVRGITAFVLFYRLPWMCGSHAPLQDGIRALQFVREHASTWGINPHLVGLVGFSAGGHLALGVTTHFAHPFGVRPEKGCVPSSSSSPWWHRNPAPIPPDFLVLLYPIVNMGNGDGCVPLCRRALLGDNPHPSLVDFYNLDQHVHSWMPPTFVVQSSGDTCAPRNHTLQLAKAYRRAHRPLRLHLLRGHCHGYGIGMCPMTNFSYTECACALSSDEESWTTRLEAWMRLRLGMTGIRGTYPRTRPQSPAQ